MTHIKEMPTESLYNLYWASHFGDLEMERQTEIRQQPKQRIQFDFTPEALRRLEDLKETVEASTKAEEIRNGIKLYEWFATQVDPTYVIEVKNIEGDIVF